MQRKFPMTSEKEIASFNRIPEEGEAEVLVFNCIGNAMKLIDKNVYMQPLAFFIFLHSLQIYPLFLWKSNHSSFLSILLQNIIAIYIFSTYYLSFPAHLFVCVSIHLSIHLSVSITIDLFIHPPNHSSVFLPIYPSNHPTAFLPFYLSHHSSI